MTRKLIAAGEKVAQLVLIDTYATRRPRLSLRQRMQRRLAEFKNLKSDQKWEFAAQQMRHAGRKVRESVVHLRRLAMWRMYSNDRHQVAGEPKYFPVAEANAMAAWAYRRRPCNCDAVLIKAELQPYDHPEMHDLWRELIQGDYQTRSVPGHHLDILAEPHVRELARELNACFSNIQAERGGH